jgi:hypothetical protein
MLQSTRILTPLHLPELMLRLPSLISKIKRRTVPISIVIHHILLPGNNVLFWSMSMIERKK